MVTRDVSGWGPDQRRATTALMQLMETFGAIGLGYYFAVNDAERWAQLLVWAKGARRYVEVSGGVAADAIELRFGELAIHVQGPAREATGEDHRRAQVQRDAEET